jgi:hypothetical protein
MKNLYTTKYRPIGYGTVPNGTYVMVERGTGGYFPKRTDLPDGKTVYGVMQFERQLTPRELEAFEIIPVTLQVSE